MEGALLERWHGLDRAVLPAHGHAAPLELSHGAADLQLPLSPRNVQPCAISSRSGEASPSSAGAAAPSVSVETTYENTFRGVLVAMGRWKPPRRYGLLSERRPHINPEAGCVSCPIASDRCALVPQVAMAAISKRVIACSMAVTSTHIVIPVQVTDDASSLVSVGWSVGASIDDEALEELARTAGPAGHTIDTRRRGGAGYSSAETLEVVINAVTSVLDEAFWVGVGLALDRLWDRLAEPSQNRPDERAALNAAKLDILVAFPHENSRALTIVGSGYSSDEPSREFTFRSPTDEYLVTLRATPKGMPYVVARRRTSSSSDPS